MSKKGRTLISLIREIIKWGYDRLPDEKIHTKMFLTPADAMQQMAAEAGDPGS